MTWQNNRNGAGANGTPFESVDQILDPAEFAVRGNGERLPHEVNLFAKGVSALDAVVTEDPYLNCVQRREHGQPGDKCVETARLA